MENNQSPHVVMIPGVGIGHLNPMMELAKSLSNCHSLTISFLTHAGQFPASSLKELSECSNISCISLPLAYTLDVSASTKMVVKISMLMKRSVVPLRNLLPSIQPVTAFILDMFCTDLLDVAAELDVPVYILFSSNATVLSLCLYMPVLHEEIEGDYKDLDMVKFPGCMPFRGIELVLPMLDREDTEYWWLLHHCRRYKEATGILINTIDELEPNAISALVQGRDYGGNIPPVHPVGPLVKIVDESDDEEISREDCLKWLDKQPRGSVLFVCLGSGGTLTQEQLVELAWGLETSGQRFLWVVKKPHNVSHAAYFETGRRIHDDDPLCFLPEGFMEKVADMGMVVSDWAPQVKVLSHEAVGGFLSHCGWNSTLESITHGVPMIAWPLFAEQRMNSRMLVEEIGIAVGVSWEKGLVLRGEVAQAVRLLMEEEVGTKLRKKVSELSRVAMEALGEKGSSHLRISQLLDNWAKTEVPNGLDSVCLSASRVS